MHNLPLFLSLLYTRILDNIHIRFCNKLYRQIAGFFNVYKLCPTCSRFLFCNFSDDNRADIIEAFNSTSRYLDTLLNINNPYFEGMVNKIYPLELQLNKANASDTDAPFLDLHLSVSNCFVSTKIMISAMILILT